MHLFCPAREMGENQVFPGQRSVWELQTCHLLSPPFQHGALQTHFALTAVGFILLVWHRGQTKLHSLPGKWLFSQAWMKLWHGEAE